jgi:hypothetical protein
MGKIFLCLFHHYDKKLRMGIDTVEKNRNKMTLFFYLSGITRIQAKPVEGLFMGCGLPV